MHKFISTTTSNSNSPRYVQTSSKQSHYLPKVIEVSRGQLSPTRLTAALNDVMYQSKKYSPTKNRSVTGGASGSGSTGSTNNNNQSYRNSNSNVVSNNSGYNSKNNSGTGAYNRDGGLPVTSSPMKSQIQTSQTMKSSLKVSQQSNNDSKNPPYNMNNSINTPSSSVNNNNNNGGMNSGNNNNINHAALGITNRTELSLFNTQVNSGPHYTVPNPFEMKTFKVVTNPVNPLTVKSSTGTLKNFQTSVAAANAKTSGKGGNNNSDPTKLKK